MFDSCRRDIHYLRLSVTDRCNLRCRYCMPDGAKIPEHEEVLTHDEFLRLAALFAQCGIDTVRVTGGEPLVRKSVAQLVAGLKATPGIRHVSMTTNGTLLAQQLPALLDAGLDSVNISLDTLDPAVFRHITARDEFAAVQAGLRAALESPLPVKLNCVPQVGVNECELEAIAALARDNDLQVRFIEMMPIGYGAAMPCVSGPELRARFANRWPELPTVAQACAALAALRGHILALIAEVHQGAQVVVHHKNDVAAAAAVAAVRAACGHEFFTVKAHRTVAALARVEPYRGDVDKVGLCCHTAPPYFHQKEPGQNGPALRLQLFRKKLLLDAALLAVLAHALKTDGAVHQSKQGVIAALANVLTRHDVGATLTDQDVAGQNELTVCTLGAQTLCCGIAAVLGAAYALFMCHCNLPP